MKIKKILSQINYLNFSKKFKKCIDRESNLR